jgi:hypothetical protein
VTGQPRTIHVALVDGDRVWVGADGHLPSFVHEREAGGPTPTATASRLLTHAFHLAPPVVVDETTRLHVVGSRGGTPDGGRWASFDGLPAELRDHAVRCVEEHRGTPPVNRPDWYRAGWHEEVESWVDSVLTPTGRTRTGPLHTHRVWSISAVLTVPTDAGDLWFKASCEHFGAEAGIVAVVAAHLPDLALEVVAVDRDRGWLLTEPLADLSDAGPPADTGTLLASRWTAAQLRSLDWLDELRAAGAPDRGLEPTLAAWRAALETSPELDALTPDERAALARAVPVVESRLREFWSCGFPDTLAHGDLHAGNVASDGHRVRIFDWSDGCITHPFLDGTHLAHWTDEESGEEDVADRVRTVLAPWRDAFPDADFDRAVELAPLADLVFQTVTFDALVRGTEPGVGDFDRVVIWLTRKVLEAVAAEEPT